MYLRKRMDEHTKLIALCLTALVVAECIGSSFLTGWIQFAVLPVIFVTGLAWGWYAQKAWTERRRRIFQLRRNLR